MNLQRFTQKSQEALQDAQSAAIRHGHTEVDTEHLLAALVVQPDGLLPRLLARIEVSIEELARRLDEELTRRPRVTHGAGAEPGQVYASPRLQQVLVAAESEASQRRDEYVSV